MPDDSNEVVVIVPDAPGNAATGSADGLAPTESEPVVVEVFDAVVDPTGSNDPTDPTASATTTGEPEVIVVETAASPDGEPEVIVIEPGADAPDTETGSAADPTSQSDPGNDPTGVADPIAATPDTGDAPTLGDQGPEGSVDPIGTSPDTGDGTASPGGTDPTDSTTAGSDDPTAGGIIGSDPDMTPADPDTTGTTDPDATGTTDPDSQTQSDTLTADQQTLQQEEQEEGKAAASGDYATAQNDAQQAYEQSQTVANEGGPDSTDQTWEAAQNESWANWDQQTADQDQQTAQSYAESGNPDDAQIYSDAAQNEQQNADNYGEAGEYGDPLGEPVDTPAATDDAPAEEAPVDDTPVDDSAAVDTSAVDDDSSAT